MTEQKQDHTVTLTAIQEFRKFLDVLEEFIKSTAEEQLIEEQQE